MRWIGVVAIALLAGCSTAPRALSLEDAPTYEKGLRIFPSPRTFDGPGTIYRVDPQGVRHAVVDLSSLLLIVPRDEAVPRLSVTGNFNPGALFSWLGAAHVSAQFQRIDSATVDITGAKREQGFEVDLQRVIDSASKIIDWSKPGKLYLITETVLADSVQFTLSSSVRFVVGDSLSADSATTHGVFVRWTPQSASHLALRFAKPHRVLFKADQLVRRSGLENGTIPRVVRVRTTQPDVWVSEDPRR